MSAPRPGRRGTRSRSTSRRVTNVMMTAAALLFAESDFTALDVLHEYVGFVGSFFIVGAVSFYFLLMRPALGTIAAAMTSAARTAARIGSVGALLRLLALAMTINTTMA